MGEAWRENENIIIAGDFNYPEISWSNATLTSNSFVAQEFLAGYQQWNCTQLINENTRIRGDQKSQLDLLLVSDRKIIADVKMGPALGHSDHVVITATAQINIKMRSTKRVLKRNFWTADYTVVKNNLREQLTTQSVPEQACMEEIEEAPRKVIVRSHLKDVE